jgi:hypothetical protein
MINLSTGQVEYAVIEHGGLLGVGSKLFAIPFNELRVDEDKEIFVLNRDKDYVKESPGFDSSHWPATNDHSYFDSVNSYYNRPPVPDHSAHLLASGRSRLYLYQPRRRAN